MVMRRLPKEFRERLETLGGKPVARRDPWKLWMAKARYEYWTEPWDKRIRFRAVARRAEGRWGTAAYYDGLGRKLKIKKPKQST